MLELCEPLPPNYVQKMAKLCAKMARLCSIWPNYAHISKFLASFKPFYRSFPNFWPVWTILSVFSDVRSRSDDRLINYIPQEQ